MTPVRRTLLIILAFVAVTAGSFIWFIATWDPAARTSDAPPPLHLWQNTPGSGAEPRFTTPSTRNA